MPPLTLSPSTLALPSLPFTTIIEADHASITALALQFHSTPTLSPSLLTEITWRLIRHDVSEELVMRPAFIRYLGAEGEEMARHDREDHRVLKGRLVEVLGLVSEMGKEENRLRKEAEDRLRKELKGMFRDMQRHMDEESGGQLVHFEKIVDCETSLALGREYAITLALTPDVFPGGVAEYIAADIRCFREVMGGLVENAAGGGDGGHLLSLVTKELGVLPGVLSGSKL